MSILEYLRSSSIKIKSKQPPRFEVHRWGTGEAEGGRGRLVGRGCRYRGQGRETVGHLDGGQRFPYAPHFHSVLKTFDFGSLEATSA